LDLTTEPTTPLIAALSAHPRIWADGEQALGYEAIDALTDAFEPPFGWLPEQPALQANLRVWENCVLPRSYFGVAPGDGLLARLELLVQTPVFGSLAEVLDQRPEHMGGAQQSLVCALRTILTRPSLILAETGWFASFDSATAAELVAMFACECPGARWLALGTSPPPAAWGAFVRQTEFGTST
jgi:ABC-type lipoprotein export system ATPase subunit